MAGRIVAFKAVDEDGLEVTLDVAQASRTLLIPRGFGRYLPAFTQGDPGTPGQPGSAGKTAYQLAVDAGYTGTLAQWLASLVGQAGSSVMLRNATVTLSAFLVTETSRDVTVTWLNPSTGAAQPFPDTAYQVMQPAVVATGVAIGTLSASLKPGTLTTTGCTITVRTTGLAIAAGQIVTVTALR